MIIDYLCRVHRIPAFDYNRPDAPGVLVAAGTGLMLSLMDRHPSIGWCVDVDCLTIEEKDRLANWLPCVANVRDFIAVAGWFATTSPLPLARAVERVSPRKLCCYIQFHGVGPDVFAPMRTAHDLTELSAQIDARSF
jgi:hypothetical protein